MGTPETQECEVADSGIDVLVQKADELVGMVKDRTLELKDALNSDVILDLQSAFNRWRSSLDQYRTAKLWLMYMDLTSILRSLICAARTGQWLLYLQSLHQMLPYLAATGHNNYVKSLVLYLDKMNKLKESHPTVHARFMDGLFVVHRSENSFAGMFSDLYIESVLMASVKSVGGLTRGRGFDESNSLVWMLSMPTCAEVHKAMLQVSGLSVDYTEGAHKDLSQARMLRDARDLQSIMAYFAEREPFSKNGSVLRSLSSGVIGDASVNVDSAEDVGRSILASMDGQSVAQFKFLKKKQVINLGAATYASVGGEKLEIEPQHLYQRLLVAGMGTVEIHELLEHELCSYPPSLFDSQMQMRSGDKAELQNALIAKVPSCVVNASPAASEYVIDGGGLLQTLPWPKSTTYAGLCQLYVDYVIRHFGQAIIVFDGYSNEPSTKDETHQKRAGHEIGPDVDVKRDMLLRMKKKPFLANLRNKQKFISLLGSVMEEHSLLVKHACGDADYDIAMAACASAHTKPVIVVATDTDILILLLHHYDHTSSEPVFLQTKSKLVDISIMCTNLSYELRCSLLFIHALSGCDTTSRPYGIGKVSVMNKYSVLFSLAQTFLSPDSNLECIDKCGEKALNVLYGGLSGSDLNFSRTSKFSEKVVSTSSYVPPERLPPTSDAARYHSRRVYHQVQTWLGVILDPTDWGWVREITTERTFFKPQRMSQPAAPSSLLNIIHCNCGGKCDKKTCSCRKNGLCCTAACGQCKGITCSNRQPHDLQDSTG